MIVKNCVGYFEFPNRCAHELLSITNSCAGLQPAIRIRLPPWA